MRSSRRKRNMTTFGERKREKIQQTKIRGGTVQEEEKLGENSVLETRHRFYIQRQSNYHKSLR